jgi:hypothetical protein
MSQIRLSVINMSQYYGLKVFSYMKYIYKLHIKNIYIRYLSIIGNITIDIRLLSLVIKAR